MTDEEIINKLSYYLDNEEELNKITNKGMEYAKNHTQEKYAESFVNIVKEFLEETK
jgi:glycosyltransferase involved in cell wall biosynthesis